MVPLLGTEVLWHVAIWFTVDSRSAKLSHVVPTDVRHRRLTRLQRARALPENKALRNCPVLCPLCHVCLGSNGVLSDMALLWYLCADLLQQLTQPSACLCLARFMRKLRVNVKYLQILPCL